MTKQHFEEGDLRAVETHIADLLAGDEAAEGALIALGRDAAGIVARIAEQKKNDQLKVLAKRLIAVPPQNPTNLMELRIDAVKELVASALEKPPNATDVRDFRIASSQVAIFDPLRVLESLVKGGKPRRDPQRVGKGDLVWFGASAESIAVTLSTSPPPEGQVLLSNRLCVDSGIVFVGPPEAGDGPRLGEVRLDPFVTNLHLFLPRGRLVRLKPGVWSASAYQGDAGVVNVHLTVDPDPRGDAPQADLGALSMLPFSASTR